MKKHIKVRYGGENGKDLVHIEMPNDYTLCGIDTDGDSIDLLGVEYNDAGNTTERVTCADCIAMFDFCKSIRASELDRKNAMSVDDVVRAILDEE